MFAAQLADVQFLANAAHFGKPRIADMAVVRPDDGFGLRSLCSKQQFERFEHMRIAQIPAFRRAMIHHPIISLGIGDKAGVLCGVKEFRSEEHTSELQSLMRTSYAVFCLKKKKTE